MSGDFLEQMAAGSRQRADAARLIATLESLLCSVKLSVPVMFTAAVLMPTCAPEISDRSSVDFCDRLNVPALDNHMTAVIVA